MEPHTVGGVPPPPSTALPPLVAKPVAPESPPTSDTAPARTRKPPNKKKKFSARGPDIESLIQSATAMNPANLRLLVRRARTAMSGYARESTTD